MEPATAAVPSVASLLAEGGLGARLAQAIIPTGFEPLDSVLNGGLRTGGLVLLGGAPGIGKSVTALQWARSAAARGIPAVYACYEHDVSTLLTRLRRSVADAVMANGDLDDVIAGSLVLRAAKARLAGYGDSLFLHEASPTEVDVTALERLVIDKTDVNAQRAFRNIPTVRLAEAGHVTTYDVMWAEDLVFSTSTINSLANPAGFDVSESDFVKEEATSTQGGDS